MTASNFSRSLELVLKHEGGYVDHPKDPGGATNMGITIGTLSAWRKTAVSKADVKALTLAEAAAIYRKNYWDEVRGDDLPIGIDYAVFDFAVNSGLGRAIPFLQDCVKAERDGKLGPKTLAAVSSTDAAHLITDLCDRRLAWLKRLSTWSTFGKGWQKRVDGVKKEGLAMLVKPAPSPVPIPQPPPDIPKPQPVTKPKSFWAAFLEFLGFRSA